MLFLTSWRVPGQFVLPGPGHSRGHRSVPASRELGAGRWGGSVPSGL